MSPPRPFEPGWRAAPRAAFDLDRTATGAGTVPVRIGDRTHRVYRNANFSVYSAQTCNARCPFCVEELRPLSRGLELLDQRRVEPDDGRYFARLEAALDAVAPVDPSVSITGGEPSIDPRLPGIVDLLARRGARKRTMTTNASGLLRPLPGGGDVLDRVLAAGLEHLNISRAHPDFAVNQRVMGVDGPIPDAGLAEVARRCADAGVRVRLSCALLTGRIDDLDGCLRYLEQAAAWGVEDVIFRQLMRYDPATVQRNHITRYSDRHRASMRPILEAIHPSDGAPGHDRFTFVRQVLGYYYYVEVYRFAGPRGPMRVCFEGADLADVQRDAERRAQPVVHELVFHPDTTLSSTWQPWDGILL